jgi:arabinose-5-phosphate isomerase
MSFIEWGKQVLDQEIAALEAMRNRLDNKFTIAVKATKSCKGKVIVTGIGKSGHVARKIAATMASLGIPSFFLHSCEAMHGDTGMIQSKDLLIAISNSGNTREVVETASRARQIGTKVIAMTGNKESALAAVADIILDIYVESEADHLNLAPTSSSTATIALGDALAVAASRAIEFTKSDFNFFHSGGELGNKSK